MWKTQGSETQDDYKTALKNVKRIQLQETNPDGAPSEKMVRVIAIRTNLRVMARRGMSEVEGSRVVITSY
jgi:hypothetical protein